VLSTFRFSSNEEDFGYQQVAAVWTKDYLLSLALRGNLSFLDQNDSSKPKKTLKGHQATLTASAVDPVSKQVYVADLTGRVCRYEGKSSEAEEISGKGHGATPITFIAVNSNGSKFVTVGNDDNFLVSETKGDSFGNASVALGGQLAGAALSNKNRHRAFVATKTQKLLIIDFSGSPSIVGELELPWKPTTMALSPNDEQIAVAGAEKLILISVSGDRLTVADKLEKHVAHISALAYSGDGRYLASADRDRLVWVWDRSKGEPLNSGWKFHDSMPTSVEFSPDSTKCLTASMDGNIIVWKDLETFSNKARGACENAHLGGVHSAHWIDNTSFVSIGDDRTIKFWTLK
jgi:WD40 repeat protein